MIYEDLKVWSWAPAADERKLRHACRAENAKRQLVLAGKAVSW